MNEKMKILISTGPMDEDWLVAEIYFGEELWAEVSEWGKKLVIYPRQNGKSWDFSTDEAIGILKIAKEKVGHYSAAT